MSPQKKNNGKKAQAIFVRAYPSWSYHVICPFCGSINYFKEGWDVLSIICKSCGKSIEREGS